MTEILSNALALANAIIIFSVAAALFVMPTDCKDCKNSCKCGD